MIMTINEALILITEIKARRAELINLRSEVSTKDVWIEAAKTKEPLYDVKKVDAKIVELQAFLFEANAAIKAANAVTNIGLSADVKQLLAPLE